MVGGDRLSVRLQAAWDAVKGALRPRVHVFLASSPIHMEYKLKMTEDQVVTNAVAACKALREMGCNDIEFSPEDATRCDLPWCSTARQVRLVIVFRPALVQCCQTQQTSVV
jgi:isopropylmalate/homocitrate/citramalate synthase